MRIAIVGSSGYIAQYILRRLSKVSEIESILKIGRNESDDAYLDLSKAEEFDYELLNDIDIIIFFDEVKYRRSYDYKLRGIGTLYVG